MARLAHRHFLTRAERRARSPRSGTDRISPIGWAFAALAGAWAAVRLRPLLDPGALDPMDWGDATMLVVATLGQAARIALPAALAFGFVAAPRRNPWLWRASMLLALTTFVAPLTSWIRDRIIELLDPELERIFDPASPPGLTFVAFGAVGIGISILALVALAFGLQDAGARLSRPLVIVLAALGGAFAILAIAPFTVIGSTAGGVTPELAWFVVSVALTSILHALWFIVVGQLIAGVRLGLVPVAAWAIAVVTGLLGASVLILSAALTGIGGGLPDWAFTAFGIVTSLIWVPLFVAFALGLGRGPRARTRQFAIWAPAQPARS